jgi:hypothetical protein
MESLGEQEQSILLQHPSSPSHHSNRRGLDGLLSEKPGNPLETMQNHSKIYLDSKACILNEGDIANKEAKLDS